MHYIGATSFLFIIGLLSSPSQQKLTVYSPQELKDLFLESDGEIYA